MLISGFLKATPETLGMGIPVCVMALIAGTKILFIKLLTIPSRTLQIYVCVCVCIKAKQKQKKLESAR